MRQRKDDTRKPGQAAMLYIQICNLCQAGVVGLWLCSDGRIVLMCDECDAAWIDPSHTECVDHFLPTNGTILPGLGCQIMRWATREEVVAAGWEEYIAGEYMPPDQRGSRA
jgi:hypothetical protein